jgi:hypothetical protein
MFTLQVSHFKWSTPAGLKPYSMCPETYSTYSASKGVIRGFCKNCGSTLIWYDTNTPELEIMVGTIDDIQAANLEIKDAVFPILSTHSSIGVRMRSKDGKYRPEI